MSQHILLTGCAGFIGSNFVKTIACRADVKPHYSFHIIDALTYAGHFANIQNEVETNSHLTFEKMDISDSAALRALFERHQFSGVLNFAAESHVDRSIANPNIFVETNVLGTLNLLNESLRLFTKSGSFRYLQVSTDEVYGSLGLTDAPFTESHPIAPNSPYSASKASADLLVRSFHETYHLPTITTRCSNNYGSLQDEEKFIPTMIRKALLDQPMPVYGNGKNVRDWIYVDDHNEGIWSAFTHGKSGQIYNFGGNCEKQNIDIAKTILKKLNKPESLIHFVEDRKGHDFRYAIDFGKAHTDLNWQPKTFLDNTGLDLTIKYYVNRWSKNIQK